MKAGLPPSMDYNQMLVVSVFLHLLAITVMMFSPKPKVTQKLIVPMFNLEVVDVPAQRRGAPVAPPKETVKSKEAVEPPPSEKAKEVKPTPPVEKAPEPKPAKKAAPPPVEKPEAKKKTVKSKLVEELELLDEKPAKHSIVKELDQLAKLTHPPQEKKQKAEAQKSAQKKENQKKEELAEREPEPDISAKKHAESKKDSQEKTAAELIEEFRSSVKPLKVPSTSKQVDVSMFTGQSFSSALHNLDFPGVGKIPVSGSPDPLSLYIGLVRDKINSNWKIPTGAERKEVYVSFFIFSQGNIGKPFIEKSSGIEQLDSLAVRAILDSDPLPKFPPDMKEPSLHMTIHFEYKTQD